MIACHFAEISCLIYSSAHCTIRDVLLSQYFHSLDLLTLANTRKTLPFPPVFRALARTQIELPHANAPYTIVCTTRDARDETAFTLSVFANDAGVTLAPLPPPSEAFARALRDVEQVKRIKPIFAVFS